MANASQTSRIHAKGGFDELVRATLGRLRSRENVDFDAIERDLSDADASNPNKIGALRALLDATRRASSANAGTVDSHEGERSDDFSEAEEDIELLRESLSGYHVIERIDRGGQGAVYLAEQKGTNRLVAIKVLLDGPLATEQQKRRFRREVLLSSHLQHPNIVSVYDSGTVRGRHYLAMEYVEGISIDGYVLLNNPSVTECVQMFLKVCRAVSHAHQRGVIHRDIKPSNILVDLDGEPHILDFGFAKASEVVWEEETAQISTSRQAVGTLQYMSPERVTCREDGSDVRSDVYALGVVLYELIAGQLPIPFDVDREKMRMGIAAGGIRPLRKVVDPLDPDNRVTTGSVNEDLNQIVLKALANEKEGRYQSADALAADLNRYLVGEIVEARSGNKRYLLKATMRRYRKHIAIAAAFVLVLIVSLVGVLIMWRQNVQNAKMWQAGLTMGAFVQLGGVERDEARVDQAIAMFEQAIQIAENAATVDGLVLRQLASAHNQLGLLLVEQGRLDDAQQHAEAIADVARRLAEIEPDAPDSRNFLALAASLRGEVCMHRKEWDKALESYDYMRQVTLDLIEETDADDALKKGLTLMEGRRGSCLRKMGRDEEAKVAYEAKLSLAQEALEARPESLDAQMTVIFGLQTLGIWYMERMTPQGYDEALRLFDDAKNRIEQLNESGRGAPRQRDLDRLSDAIRQNRGIIGQRQKKAAEAAETK